MSLCVLTKTESHVCVCERWEGAILTQSSDRHKEIFCGPTLTLTAGCTEKFFRGTNPDCSSLISGSYTAAHLSYISSTEQGMAV